MTAAQLVSYMLFQLDSHGAEEEVGIWGRGIEYVLCTDFLYIKFLSGHLFLLWKVFIAKELTFYTCCLSNWPRFAVM